MGDNIKFIVEQLNAAPFNKKLNLIAFDSLDPFALLQLLNDVLGEISSAHKLDLREEVPEQTAVRMFSLLRVLKYKPKGNDSLSAFRQGLIQGDKGVIYPLLEWLLKRLPELRTRAYLARFLVKIEVPTEHLQDDQVSEANRCYEELMVQFKDLHKTLEQYRSSGFSVAEIRNDISSMEEEKEQLKKRIEKNTKRVTGIPNSESFWQAARRLRMEKDREVSLNEQQLEQKNQLLHAQQRIQQLQEHLRELKKDGIGQTADGVITQLEEETRAKKVLTQDTLPRKIETKRTTCRELEQILSVPAMTQEDLQPIRDQIGEANEEVNRLMEKHRPGNDPLQDKLTLFRQQASMISHKKEAAAENYREALDELGEMEKEQSKQKQILDDLGGGEILREDEMKKYVTKMRGLSSLYKQKKGEMSVVKAEGGVLTRTDEILQEKKTKVKETMSTIAEEKGVGGFLDTQDTIEKVSTMKSSADEQKGMELDKMSRAVEQLNAAILEKKSSLAPLVKEVRPLRSRHEQLVEAHKHSKANYDQCLAGLQSRRSSVEQEVRAYREECQQEESRYHYIQCMKKVTQVQEQKVANEMQLYIGGTNTKTKSLRDQYTRKIQEQENLGKALRDKQKDIKQHHGSHMNQVRQIYMAQLFTHNFR